MNNSANKIKVVHLVTWYPSEKKSHEAIWTKRHIDSINEYCDNYVFHLTLVEDKSESGIVKLGQNEYRISKYSKTSRWMIKELIFTRMILGDFRRHVKRITPDIINVQIAYPFLTYYHIWKRLIKVPVVVTEHWSAYRLNFGVKKKLTRIQRIFQNKELKFITVSNALKKDIERFSESEIDSEVVPNIVENVFSYSNKEKDFKQYLMVANWKEPKEPIIALDAFAKLEQEFVLKIVGDGPLLNEMKQKVVELGIKDKVNFVGVLNSEDIAIEMNKASYFVHCSGYETASVVCMEALCCGTPVIASKVGGIPEYLNDENGILVEENSLDLWEESLSKSFNLTFNYEAISKSAKKLFSSEEIGKRYFKVILDKLK